MHDVDVCSLPRRVAGCVISLEVWDIWWFWVEDYSTRKLSFLSDKLPAIAGFTRKFQELLQVVPVVGLWMEDIYYCLLWWPTRAVLRLPDLPSWSWVSVDSPVKPMYDVRSRTRLKVCAAIGPQSLTIKWTGEELTLKISSATLRVRGRLRRAWFCLGYSLVYYTGSGHSCYNKAGYQPYAQLAQDSSPHQRRASCLLFDGGLGEKDVSFESIWCLEILEEPNIFQSFLIFE